MFVVVSTLRRFAGESGAEHGIGAGLSPASTPRTFPLRTGRMRRGQTVAQRHSDTVATTDNSDGLKPEEIWNTNKQLYPA